LVLGSRKKKILKTPRVQVFEFLKLSKKYPVLGFSKPLIDWYEVGAG
jgi:hypothetical protein